MNPGTCIHYTGIGMATREDKCKAGVCYHDAFDFATKGVMLRIPCVQYRVKPANRPGTYIKPGEPTIREEIDRRGYSMLPCKHFHEPTEAEVEADRRQAADDLERAMVAMRVAAEWRISPKPALDRHDVVECPICKGRLHLTQSSYNGHVSGTCETAGCVSWME